ncbi:DUF423 domain-containing protein [Thalassoglobus sp. JC818]|uniref:DUF423 domain-containing protein n=1 Tax=Thalassoglobus sp. JC818 TaxID=3232136 RepID=UPI0034575A47
MTKDSAFWIRVGAILGGLAVVLGAFAAHGLDKPLQDLYEGQTKIVLGIEIPATQKYLADFKTAAEYQMYHAFAILILGVLPASLSRRSINIAGWSFLLGIILFSGSLYCLVLTGYTRLGMITPIGGVMFIVGWIALLLAVPSASLPGTEHSPKK